MPGLADGEVTDFSQCLFLLLRVVLWWCCMGVQACVRQSECISKVNPGMSGGATSSEPTSRACIVSEKTAQAVGVTV